MKTQKLQLIGQGAFTKCYKMNANKVLLKSCDPVKEAMSLGLTPNSRIFPKVTYTSCNNEYEMKYYSKVKSLKNSLDADQYELYKALRTVKLLNVIEVLSGRGYEILIKRFKALDIKRSVKNALIGMVEGLLNYGTDICFEISPRNVAVNNGKLVLLDCFFMHSALMDVRKK